MKKDNKFIEKLNCLSLKQQKSLINMGLCFVGLFGAIIVVVGCMVEYGYITLVGGIIIASVIIIGGHLEDLLD